MVPAEAITVHKTQGSTFKNAVFHLPAINSRPLLYVGCSRVTNADGLHLIGRFRAPAARKENDNVARELSRLRSNPVEFNLTEWSELHLSEQMTKITFHNVEDLRRHQACTFADQAFAQADIVLLVETWTKPDFVFEQSGFSLLQRLDHKPTSTNDNMGGTGSMVLVKDALIGQCQVLQK